MSGYKNVNIAPCYLLRRLPAGLANPFIEMNDVLDDETKKQLATEIIFLTHNEQLHNVNMLWHPTGEAI